MKLKTSILTIQTARNGESTQHTLKHEYVLREIMNHSKFERNFSLAKTRKNQSEEVRKIKRATRHLDFVHARPQNLADDPAIPKTKVGRQLQESQDNTKTTTRLDKTTQVQGKTK